MRRFVTLLLAAVLPGAADAHFYFILPPADGEPAKLVYADTAKVDKDADPGAAELFSVPAPARLAPGGAGYLTIAGIPAGTTELAVAPAKHVSLTNFPHPTLVIHDARWQAAPTAGQSTTAGLALTCHPAGGGTVFAATLAGKPVAAVVTVSAPGMPRPVTVETGPDGLTRSFAEKGLLSARAGYTEAKPGEYKGQKYQQVRHYATLTTTAR